MHLPPALPLVVCVVESGMSVRSCQPPQKLLQWSCDLAYLVPCRMLQSYPIVKRHATAWRSFITTPHLPCAENTAEEHQGPAGLSADRQRVLASRRWSHDSWQLVSNRWAVYHGS
jgi:hypothetical protein